MPRSRFHQHALRAAAAAAFTFTTVGCGADWPEDTAYAADADGGAFAGDADGGEPSSHDDGGALLTDSGADADAGTGGISDPCTPEDWERSFWKCCEANDWVSPDPEDPWGCTPWGPPAPPAFQGVA